MTRGKLLDSIVMLLSGRVCEQLFIGDISTGAYNDLQRATDTARRMVTEYGMSERLGPIFLGGDQEVFLGKDFGHARNYSEEIASVIDEEIRSIIEGAYKKAEELLRTGSETVQRVAKALVERERLDGAEFETLCSGGELPPLAEKEEKQVSDGGEKAQAVSAEAPGDPAQTLEEPVKQEEAPEEHENNSEQQ